MIRLRDIFDKPIDRPIDGVIKADDDASLRIELDEYIITVEIGQRLEEFLEAYNNYTTANGVWISGFFGSGKSHLLKMLAMLLENREVDGICALDVFCGKLDNNPMLAGALRKAVSIPSRSILFNIDQKADVISKTDIDALLSVFQKVFDEMCGYYGKQPHIAQFERDLDSRGQLSAFRAAFQSVAGKSWDRGREQALFEKANIAKAFAEATSASASDATDILGHYRKDTKVSIEDFANTVKAWIDRKPPKFRLNFFVDEVGQYIADNTKLMTNLQTIAESLNTKCKGQAWILVTSQQDMASVIGDMTVRQEHDFSKIQARFRRMPLNSADVPEVIQRRLLVKTEEGEIGLGNLHDQESNNLKTLFDFTDGSIRLKNFRDKDHFIASYPFPPYQYTLFQMAITGLSQHNAFEGKHSSVGERSMLGVFQDVAKLLADTAVGDFATFDQMFEGIRTALKSAVQQSIQVAEKNLDDPFAVRVLKALFLVKYVKEFKPSVRNIAILLLSAPTTDMVGERRRIEEALNTLERNTYIQRNGEVYEFLTNEEKDVESEIKALSVDQSELARQLEELIFEVIIRHRKLKHLATGNEYPFSRKLDDNLLGRDFELSINVISPFSPDAAVPDAVRMQSMTRDELCVLVGPDVRIIQDLTLHKKTEKFIRQSSSSAQLEVRNRIVAEKGAQNALRYKDLELRLRDLLGKARMFVRGEELQIGGEDPQDRIVKGFQTLVDKVYVNLPMLRGATYLEADIARAVLPENSLFGGVDAVLTEGELEVLNHAQAQARNGVKVSVKAVSERFSGKPYGWPTTAILCIVASLSARGKIEARSDSALLEGAQLASGLQNSHRLANILLTPQVEFTAAQTKRVKESYREMFDAPAGGGDARAIGGEWAQGIANLSVEIEGLLSKRDLYPFVAALDPLAETIRGVKGKAALWYVTDLSELEDELIDGKEKILDPIRQFMGGKQKDIYDDVRRFLRAQEANFPYVGDAEAKALAAVLADPACYKGGAIQGLNTALYGLKTAVELKVLEERKSVIAAIDDCADKLALAGEFQALGEDQRRKVTARLDSHKVGLDEVSLIAVLRDRANGARTRLLQEALEEVERRTQPPPPSPTPPTPGAKPPPAPAPRQDTYVQASTLTVACPKPLLSDEADVDLYVAEMRKTLLAEIRKGRKVIV